MKIIKVEQCGTCPYLTRATQTGVWHCRYKTIKPIESFDTINKDCELEGSTEPQKKPQTDLCKTCKNKNTGCEYNFPYYCSNYEQKQEKYCEDLKEKHLDEPCYLYCKKDKCIQYIYNQCTSDLYCGRSDGDKEGVDRYEPKEEGK